MRYNNILDKLCGQKSKVKIMRFLVNYKPDASIREIAREIKISPPNTSIALKELEKEGVLKSARVGRSIVYSLNIDHYLVAEIIKPLFEKERNIKNALINQIKKNIKFPFESIILFGSIQRGEEKYNSDIDLAIIVNDNKNEAIIEEKIAGFNPLIAKEFGNTLSAIIFKKSDFVKRLKNSDLLVREIAKNGKVAAGKLINELI